jgi:iron-regulated transporter 1
MRGFFSLENRILLSRFLTRSGDQAWDFAVPLALVFLFPKQFSLVAFLFFVSKLGTVIVQPWLAGVIDRWKRVHTAYLGTVMQGASVALVSVCLVLLTHLSKAPQELTHSGEFYFLFSLLALGTVTSNLGAGLMDIAVGNDWIPALVPAERLANVNSRLKQLDLFTEVTSPVLAGALMAFSAAGSPLFGFLWIAAWNLLSFLPEILLLRSVFMSSNELQQATAEPSILEKTSLLKKLTAGWVLFRRQPAAWAMVAYACLWLSALSPHGVLLTSFLRGAWNLSESSLGVFRGLGAVFGLLATVFFPLVRRRWGLLSGTRAFILFQTAMVLACFPFFLSPWAGGWAFLGCILLSRIGLYGFSLGETEIRQTFIPEGQRGSVNGVAGALTSLASLVLFGLGSLLSTADQFLWLVVISMCAVTLGALVFSLWMRRVTLSHGNAL